MTRDPYKRAKKKVKAKKGFYSHFASYLATGMFFFVMNMVTWDGELWFFFPLLPWGIGLAIHYFSVFGLPGTDVLTKEWEERELRKEMEKMGYDEEEELPYEEEEGLELREVKKETRRRGADEDFV